VSLSLSLEANCVRDRTQGLFHRLLAITSCCTDGVQLTLQNLGPKLCFFSYSISPIYVRLFVLKMWKVLNFWYVRIGVDGISVQ